MRSWFGKGTSLKLGDGLSQLCTKSLLAYIGRSTASRKIRYISISSPMGVDVRQGSEFAQWSRLESSEMLRDWNLQLSD